MPLPPDAAISAFKNTVRTLQAEHSGTVCVRVTWVPSLYVEDILVWPLCFIEVLEQETTP